MSKQLIVWIECVCMYMHMIMNEILPGGSAEGTVVTDIDVVDVAILHGKQCIL